ncbi:MAG: UDP-N-acetylglucosamine 2-epimerase (non-hydrolyzing) [Candidatus Tantalella remota]|nr:UDP-N-acetylglucosamine 2-epimerase (non-hydrolyzing) [Candidatus Tantalella remota]
MKVLTVCGTRPEAIKLAPVILQLKKDKSIRSYLCTTGQHRQMLDPMFKVFGIKPDHDMNIMRKGQSLEDIVSKVVLKMGKVLEEITPDIVLVQGDTTTAFVVSLAAYLKKIKVGHVEAGLRSNDKYKPFPEEINRRLVSHIADLHFAPTPLAARNLIRENIDKKSVFVTGNTVIDALSIVAGGKKAAEPDVLRALDPSKKIILVTAHRRESFGRDFRNMCGALKKIAVSRDDVEIVYPVHLNPEVRKTVNSTIKKVPNIHLLEPMEYVPFVRLMKRAYLVLTDSGGIQEEAPALDKPVLVMREVTERPEGIKAGCARLVGVKTADIVVGTINLLKNKKMYSRMAKAVNPYGDGKASKRIISAIKKHV